MEDYLSGKVPKQHRKRRKHILCEHESPFLTGDRSDKLWHYDNALKVWSEWTPLTGGFEIQAVGIDRKFCF